ncbi:hypothetical protein CI109_105677 [Kwoniella shandongensis]|uniref:Plasma membrane fusion protein PRM1 n=1 Tax=Kwoniella shandongensis TaxID=1734106 RepID=A0A5M6C4T1_9TREE|nr:uncharacterized protein CI109_003017 [Kwoniella shandongensis]KAA5528485.1 hypothetical protein CI109_003017 [Kwoniella shandongensis]
MAPNDPDLLRPPQRFVNPDDIIPLTPPPTRPPFSHYQSSTTLPATPHTPYSPIAPSNQRDPSPTPLRPYLSLSPRILLTFFSSALLPMILTIAHLIQNRSSTATLAASLKSSVLSACAGIAKGAASIQSMPRYLAMQTNEEAVRITQASILATGTMLIDAITITEVVVNFIVDTYRSMLLCTIELAVRGTLEILIDAVQTISDAITSSLNSIRTDIQNDIAGANNIIQTAVSGINSVTNLVHVNLTIPQFSIPSLDFLANVTIPTTFEDGLISLNSTLPTLAELKQKMDIIIDTPFELLIKEINSTRLEMAASFNSSLLPVPSLSSLAASDANDLNNDLCTGLDTSLIDDTAKALHKLSSVAIGLMFLLLFLVWAALAIWEWRKWRTLRNTVETVEEEWRREGQADAWRMVAIVEHPVLEKYSSGVIARVAPKPRTRTNIRWFLSYLSHPTCLALLFISLLGFLSIQFQLVALDAIKSHAQQNANSTVTASADNLATKLNSAAIGSSQEYADQYNAVIASYQKRIDEELFGSWVNTTAVTLNSTLVQFYDEVESALNTTFGNTVLYGPINTFVYCILGSKITNLEKGLTWISQHAHIDLPTLPADVLLLSNSSMNEIATPIAAAAVGSGSDSDDSDGIVGTLIDHFESALVVERNFYAILLGVWLGLCLIGLVVVIWHSGGKDRYVAWRGGRAGQGGDEAVAPSNVNRWKPWIKDTHPIYDNYAEKQFRGIDVPQIIEPNTAATPEPNQRDSRQARSFFDLKDDGTGSIRTRPFIPRNGTFGSTLSSLAAPGQAFLKLAGRKETDIASETFVETGQTSEKYTNDINVGARPPTEMSTRAGTPSLFWVNKFYGAVDGVKSLFPTRGQRHGAALGRNTSQRTEKSFGASQVPTALTPGNDWPRTNEAGAGKQPEPKPEWTMVDPQSIGRALDGTGDSGRYPTFPTEGQNATYEPHSVYPRPMSRAPTLAEGATIQLRGGDAANPFEDHPPPLPQKEENPYVVVAAASQQRRDDITSTNYIQDRYGSDIDHDEVEEDDDDEEERLNSYASPTSSSMSYFAAEPQVESANRVKVGGGQGTTALSSILSDLQMRREREDNPFRG